jgi:hypothetical protein
VPLRVPIAVVLAAVGLALLLAPRAAGAGPLIGVVDKARTPGSLARLDPLTLRRTSAAVPLRGYVWGRGRSPDGSRLAIGVSSRHRFLLQIVDLRRWRTERTISLARLGSTASVVSWARPDRIVALSEFGGDAAAIIADPDHGTILRRVAIRGDVRDARHTAGGIAVLSSPRKRIGRAHLTTVDADGTVRSLVLSDIRAGFVPPPTNVVRRNQVIVSRSIAPALVVDDTGTRAFVVAAGRPVVDEVDLATGAVTRHVLVSTPGRAAARAAKAEEGMNRYAEWVGAGQIAVSGYDAYLNHDDRQRMVRFGLQVIDTASWRTRRLASDPSWFVTAAPGQLVWAGSRKERGMVSYALATGRRLHRFAGRYVSMVWGGRFLYASVRSRHRTYVLDPATGRTLHVLRTARVPFLLAD